VAFLRRATGTHPATSSAHSPAVSPKKTRYPFRDDPDLKTAVLGDTASPFAPFEHRRFMCHDIHDDDVSNEPALDSNSNLLGALARRGAMAIADSARNMMLTRQQISKIDASADIATPQSVCNGTAGRLATERECRTPGRREEEACWIRRTGHGAKPLPFSGCC
jgi:hypothetical protein